MLIRPFDLEIEQGTFLLIKPRTEPAYLVRWKDETGETEHWAVIVFGMIPANIRTDVSKFIEISNVRQRVQP